MADAVISEKQCGHCGEIKPITEYQIVNKTKRRPQGNPHNLCRPCKNAYGREWTAKKAVVNPKPPKIIVVIAEKQCVGCGGTKPIDEYPIVNKSKWKPQGSPANRCIPCMKVLRRRHKEAEASRSEANPLSPETIRTCTGCGQDKPASEFHKSKHHKGGYVCKCRECVKNYKDSNKKVLYARAKEYRIANSEEILRKKHEWRAANPDIEREYRQRWYIKNIEKILQRAKEYRERPEVKELRADKHRKWIEKNPKRVEQYNRQRVKRYHSVLKFDPTHVLNRRIRSGIAKALRGNKGRRPWESLVGYTVDDLVKRLKKTMPLGYTWDDVISGALHIDHVAPVSAFNFTSHTDIDFHMCWSLKNLRLIPALDNISKGAKILRPVQTSFSGI